MLSVVSAIHLLTVKKVLLLCKMVGVVQSRKQ